MKLLIYALTGLGAYLAVWGMDYNMKQAKAEELRRLMPPARDPFPLLSRACAFKGMTARGEQVGDNEWKVTCQPR